MTEDPIFTDSDRRSPDIQSAFSLEGKNMDDIVLRFGSNANARRAGRSARWGLGVSNIARVWRARDDVPT